VVVDGRLRDAEGVPDLLAGALPGRVEEPPEVGGLEHLPLAVREPLLEGGLELVRGARDAVAGPARGQLGGGVLRLEHLDELPDIGGRGERHDDAPLAVSGGNRLWHRSLVEQRGDETLVRRRRLEHALLVVLGDDSQVRERERPLGERLDGGR